MGYFEDADDDEERDWVFLLGFYDDRNFWITQDGTLVSSPTCWLLVTDP